MAKITYEDTPANPLMVATAFQPGDLLEDSYGTRALLCARHLITFHKDTNYPTVTPLDEVLRLFRLAPTSAVIIIKK